MDTSSNTEERRIEGLSQLIEARERSALQAALAQLNPVDIAEAMSGFGAEENAFLFSALSAEAGADVLAHLDTETRSDILDMVRPEAVREAIEELPPDEAADVIAELPHDQAEEALTSLEKETQQEVRDLLQYEPDTAGGIMTTEFAVVPQDATVRDAIEKTQGESRIENLDYVYVVDKTGRPVGLIKLAELVFSPPGRTVRQIMDADIHIADVDMDQEEAAGIVQKYDLLSVPVVDKSGCIRGIITVDDIIDIVSDEASEDMYRLAGVGADDPLHQAVMARVFHRLPWLAITLVGELFAGQVMRWFGIDPTAGMAGLMIFLPVIVAMAGNVSLQSSTIMVRGIATGAIRPLKLHSLFFRELAVGSMIGLACAAVTGVAAGWLISGSAAYAFTVGGAMFCAILVATCTGTTFPLIVNRMGIDPAVASGPFVTTFNDITGITIFLTLGHFLLPLG
ncbi:MAG: magnesium transporter [Planctomycetia bacterium]|nr:magnesium transporter [Planctomycetia bacterium]